MAVCQYFLQGRCRFGQNCRNEHSQHSYHNDDRNSRNILNSQQLSTVVKKIAEVVILAEKGGQWPLSSFSPLKEGANVPGWEDYSPEEIRWKMYEARANGTLNQATLEISQLYSHAEKMRNMLKEPTVETANIIANLLRGRSESTSASNPFKSVSTSNIFGGSVQPSIQTSAQNIFGGSSSPGSPGSIFGGAATTLGNQGSIFGGSSQPTGTSFGTTVAFSNQSIFGNAISSNAFAQASLSNSQNSASGSGGSGNIFSNPAVSSQNIFSSSNEQNNQTMSGPFLSQNSSGIFSKPSAPSIFNSKNSENLNQNQPFSFNSSQNANIFMSPKTDIFGSLSQATKAGQQSVFGSPQQNLPEYDSSIYSKVEDLNEEEIQSFTSATFGFGKIPLKPPPKNFCK